MRDNYILNENGNIIRWICLLLSGITCLLLIFRIFQYEDYANLKYLLNLSNQSKTIFILVMNKKINVKTFLIEMLIQIIQPYPYVSTHWVTKTIGNDIHYSMSAILFSFCILRLYVCVKVIRYWNFYSNSRSRRIFTFFGNYSIDLFLYKANIKGRGLYTISFISAVFLYISALIFKIYEDYETKEEVGFSYIWNCLWFLIVTITTSKFFQ